MCSSQRCFPLSQPHQTQIRAADWHLGKRWGSSVKNFCLFFTSSRHRCAAREIREAWRDEIAVEDERRCQTVAWESTKGHAHPRQRWNGGRHKGWKLPSCETYGGNWENDTSSQWITVRDTHKTHIQDGFIVGVSPCEDPWKAHFFCWNFLRRCAAMRSREWTVDCNHRLLLCINNDVWCVFKGVFSL